MISSLLTSLLLAAADPAAAAAPARPPAAPAMAIDELGMPIDKKDKKGKGVVTGGPRDCDDAACRAAAAAVCAATPKVITAPAVSTDTASVAPASSSSSWTGSCPAPAGMAINEKGTAGTVTKKPKPNK
jgi:hypothetical protein